MLLVQQASRAKYEDVFPVGEGPSVWAMTDEDIALADHIFDEYDRLVRGIEPGRWPLRLPQC